MAKRKEEEANHWPGFVDAFSTVVLVLIFVLIIVLVALSFMAKKVPEGIVQDVVQKMEEADPSSTPAPQDAESLGEGAGRIARGGNTVQSTDEETTDPLASPHGEDAEVMGSSTKVSRSRTVEEPKRFVVAPDEGQGEEPEEDAEVESTPLMITVDYPETMLEINESTRLQIQEFLEQDPTLVETAELEVRAFSNSKVGSVSDARRVAYYRAIHMRNFLLEMGADPARIKVKVDNAESDEEYHRVNVMIKR